MDQNIDHHHHHDSVATACNEDDNVSNTANFESLSSCCHSTQRPSTTNRCGSNSNETCHHSDDNVTMIQDQYGNTMLHDACSDGNIPRIKELLRHRGANPNIQNHMGQTCLHREMMMMMMKNRRRISGGEIHNPDDNDNNDDDDVVSLLLQHQADVNICDRDGYTPLHILLSHTRWYHMNLIKLLLRYGANPNIPTKKGTTCFHICCIRRALAPIKLFVTAAMASTTSGINIPDHSGNTPLHYAFGFCSNTNAIMYYDTQHHQEMIIFLQYLLQNGANPNIPNKWGRTVLHYMCRNITHRHTNHHHHNHMMIELIQIMIQYHADMNISDINGNTPFYSMIQNLCGGWLSRNTTTIPMTIITTQQQQQQQQLPDDVIQFIRFLLRNDQVDYKIKNRYGKDAMALVTITQEDEEENHNRGYYYYDTVKQQQIIDCLEEAITYHRNRSCHFLLYHWMNLTNEDITTTITTTTTNITTLCHDMMNQHDHDDDNMNLDE